MSQEYQVLAWSPSTGQYQREIYLNTPAPRDAHTAQMLADSFALRLRSHSPIVDWIGRIDLIDPHFSIRV